MVTNRLFSNLNYEELREMEIVSVGVAQIDYYYENIF